MNLWEFLLLSGVAGFIYSAWRTAHLSKMGAYQDFKGEIHPINTGREAELESEVEELRERVKVLERIATDGRETRLLSDEIEKLRESKGKVQ